MTTLAAFHPVLLDAAPTPVRLAHVQHEATLTDPASTVFTDLRHGPCISVDYDDGLDQTLTVMVKAGVHMAFVAGLHGDIIGMITADDLQGERPVVRALSEHVRHDDLTLADMMVPASQWRVTHLQQIAHARIGDIVATLRDAGLRYLLVTERTEAGSLLIGVFSARRIELALKTVIAPDLHFRSFAELGHTLSR